MNANKKRILLVEDQTIIAIDECRFLESNNFEVIHVKNGLDAIKAVSTETDLVLMDINLGPGMNGLEAAKNILESMDIPIIFLSSNTSKTVVEKAASISPYGYVVKNNGPYVLMSAIQTALSLHRARVSVAEEVRNCIQNSLYLLSGIVGEEKDDTAGCVVRCEEFVSRVEILSIICGQLSRYRNNTALSLRMPIEELVESIKKVLQLENRIDIRTYVDNVTICSGQYIPVSLLIHELIASAVECDYPAGHRGFMILSLCKKNDETIEIMLGNDGVAVQDDQNTCSNSHLTLAGQIAACLSAKIEKKYGDGMTYRINIPGITTV